MPTLDSQIKRCESICLFYQILIYYEVHINNENFKIEFVKEKKSLFSII